MTRLYPIDDPSRVAEVRRAAVLIAEAEKLGQTLAAHVSLIATEICTNLVKYATHGEVLLSGLADRGEPGVEILAVDRGPGMTDVARCLVDGYSSANTAGTGLGAIIRLSQEFDIYSQRDKGTVLAARIRERDTNPTSVGAFLKPIAGEDVSGDNWAVFNRDHETCLIVADGIGHGVSAAQASAEAVAAFRLSEFHSPQRVLERIHASLRGTRGAAVAVAFIDRLKATVRYTGIGNIVGAIVSSGRPRLMVSHNGTAGFYSPRFQEFSYPFPREALVIMHSDGLHSNWNLDDYPDLRRRDPALIAAVLCRDAARTRDDACVVVVNTEASV